MGVTEIPEESAKGLAEKEHKNGMRKRPLTELARKERWETVKWRSYGSENPPNLLP